LTFSPSSWKTFSRLLPVEKKRFRVAKATATKELFGFKIFFC
jgi:hypothetical protein